MGRRLGSLRIAAILLPLYWLAIFIGTHLPPRTMLQLRTSDKLLHCLAFFGLNFLLCWAISTNKTNRFRNVWVAIGICTLYAVFDELSQLLVGRSAEVADFAADLVGTILGALTYVSLRAALTRMKTGAPGPSAEVGLNSKAS